MPGRFLHISYLLISIFRGYIHAEPLENRQKANLTAAYRATYKFFADLGHRPQFQMLDNEDSDLLRNFFTEEAKVVAEFVPPNTHRRNRAERSIQDWKGHHIACLDMVDKNCTQLSFKCLRIAETVRVTGNRDIIVCFTTAVMFFFYR